jgi:D-3-phosphoglycerate dehydrogenase
MDGLNSASADGLRVLLTDHPWPDLEVERGVLGAAGLELAAPADPRPAPAGAIDAFVQRVNPAAIMTCWAPVSAAAVRAPSALQIVARLGVGIDNIAVAEATARGSWVTNVPGYCVEEVSDHAVGLVLASFRGITYLDRDVKRGVWNPAAARLQRLRDATIGVLGFGAIGAAIARKFAGLGCRVLVYRRHFPAPPPAPLEAAEPARIRAQADVIVLALPLTNETRGLVDAAFIAGLQRAPLLVNVSRGGLVENGALIAGLVSGALRGAALDVIDGEPNVPAALLQRDDVILTPHVGFSSLASVLEVRRRACEEVVRVLRGEAPLHPCNAPARQNGPRVAGV